MNLGFETPRGYRSLLAWAFELGVLAFAVEGCGSYGAGLVRFLESLLASPSGSASGHDARSAGAARAI